MLTKIIKIISILTAFLLIAAIFYSIRSRSGSHRTINPKEDRFGIGSNFDENYLKNKFWNDGQEEIAVYKAEYVYDNETVGFDCRVISKPEFFSQEFNVKSDSMQRLDLFRLMKVNMLSSFQTKRSLYHLMNSTFIKAENPLDVYKVIQTSQDFYGITFKEFNQDKHHVMKFSYSSYLDKEGKNSRDFETAFLFEDQLMYSLRTLKFKEGLKFNQSVMESQAFHRIGRTHLYDTEFTVTDGGELEAFSGNVPTWKVTLVFDQKKVNEYWFSKNYPHICFKMNGWDGRKLELKELSYTK